jgi:trehalose-phosphatase
MTHPALPVNEEMARRLLGRPLVLLLDLDGTLAPIVPRPEYAALSGDMKRVLCDLVELPETSLAIVSGRAAADARRIVDVPGVWVIGNHGFELATPDAEPVPRSGVAEFEAQMQRATVAAEKVARDCPGVVVENKKWTLSVHYRLAHPRIVPEIIAAVRAIGLDLDLRVTNGKEVVELRPPLAVDKGIASVELARSLGAMRGGSVLYAGDDRTDEDAFRALRAEYDRSVTVRVGAEQLPDRSTTHAEFDLADTAAMRQLLEWIRDARSGAAAAP